MHCIRIRITKVFALLLLVQSAIAQDKKILNDVATVMDSVSHQSLEGASIMLLDENDSIKMWGHLTDKNGYFKIPFLKEGKYILRIGFEGYKPVWQNIIVNNGEANSFPRFFYLTPAFEQLDSAVIEAHRRPDMEMRGDTMSFLADRYHTRSYATLGELLNKLPGLDVDMNGNVTAFGKQVTKVLVNGNPFLGDDPTIIIKNLPRDMTYRIEIYNDLSDESKFTRVDDGVRIVTINIITKYEIKGGTVGLASTGFANEGLFNDGFQLNYAKARMTTNLSVSVENVPAEWNYQFSSLLGSAPAQPSMQSSMLLANLHYGDSVFSDKAKLKIGYSQKRTVSHLNSMVKTQQILSNDSSFYSSQVQTNNASVNSSNFNFSLASFLTKTNLLTFSARAALSQNNQSGNDNSTTTNGSSIPVNNSLASNNNKINSTADGFDIDYSHKFNRIGRNLNIRLDTYEERNHSDATNFYTNKYYDVGLDSSVSAKQYSHSPTNSNSLHAEINYSESITKSSNLSLYYSFQRNKSVSDRSTLLFDSLAQKLLPDSLLSNSFTNINSSQNFGITWGYTAKSINLRAQLNFQQNNMLSLDNTNGTRLPQNYLAPKPNANLNWILDNDHSIDVEYELHIGQPSIQQLQPIIMNIDPLHTTTGNPDLKKSLTHSTNINYHSRDMNNQSFFNIGLHLSFQQNSFSQKTVINPLTGADTSRPANLNGNYDIDLHAAYFIDLKDPKSNLTLDASLSDNHTVGFINTTFNGTNNYIFSGKLTWRTNLKKRFDINLSASSTYNLLQYSSQSIQNMGYFFYTALASTSYYSDQGIRLNSVIYLTSYNGRPKGLNQTVALWNLSASHELFKKHQGEICFSIHDLLNQNSAITHTVSSSSITDTQKNLLTRYYMFSLIYHIRDFKLGKKLNG